MVFVYLKSFLKPGAQVPPLDVLPPITAQGGYILARLCTPSLHTHLKATE